MPKVVAVSFPFATHTLWFSPEDLEVQPEEIVVGREVICKTARGEEFGTIQDEPFEVDDKKLKETLGDRELSPIVRLATKEDIDKHEELVEKAFSKLPKFREFAKEQKLPIKPVGIEFTVDGKTAICYFAAEERIDFRQLVRSLANELDAKIDMHQIGVREESGGIGGFAQCGQELCCARWEKSFAPISIRMAKEQDLPLNSPKISGVCGRLMCCLRYEFDAYKDFKTRAPKVGGTVETPMGKAKVSALNTPKEIVTLSLEDEKTLDVPLQYLTCLTKDGKEAAARPNTLTRENLEKLESFEARQALAEVEAPGGMPFSPSVSSVSEGLAEEDKIEIEVKEEKAQKKSKRRRNKKGRGQRKNLKQNPKQNGRHFASGNGDTKGQLSKAKQNESEGSKSSSVQGMKRTRRRPGDKGKAIASGNFDSAKAPGSSQPRHSQKQANTPHSNTPSSHDQPNPTSGVTKRRRHHKSS